MDRDVGGEIEQAMILLVDRKVNRYSHNIQWFISMKLSALIGATTNAIEEELEEKR